MGIMSILFHLKHNTRRLELDKSQEKRNSENTDETPTPPVIKSEAALSPASCSTSATGHFVPGRNVWYRCLLKPWSRQNPAIPFRESFKRRVLRPVGITISSPEQISGLHELFVPSYRQYSPLVGMIFTYNNLVDNLYRYGNPTNSSKEPAVVLVRNLFHALPGGDIHPTHLGKCAGAHLTPAIIGAIFEALEHLKPELLVGESKLHSGESIRRLLALRLTKVILSHPDYQKNLHALFEDVRKADTELATLVKRDEESVPFRQRIKNIEGGVIKKRRHDIKRTETALKMLLATKDEVDRGRIEELKNRTFQLNTDIGAAQSVVDELRRIHIVTSADFKVARKAQSRAQGMVDLEEKNRSTFMNELAGSFCAYDIDNDSILLAHEILPKYTTTAILLSYLWRKYDEIESLSDYFKVMERMGALTCGFSSVAERIARHQTPSARMQIQTKLSFSRHVMEWTASDVATAAFLVLFKPGLAQRPPVVPFSYIKWADYCEYADCGETCLRNLFNQLVFNPITGSFDHALLSELKHRYYPDLKSKLIDFYRKHSNPRDSAEHATAKDWLTVASKLNSGRSSGPFIRYRRAKEEQNIASPMSNLIRVFNALFGVEQLDQPILQDVAGRINKLRGWKLTVDTARMRKDGSGIVDLSDGKVRYEMQSYKPVHFSFVQVETMDLDAFGRRDLEVFHRLRRYSCSPPRHSRGTLAYFEQLALASLFVPYNIQRQKDGRFFRDEPPHLKTLFADLNQSLQQQQTVFRWAAQFSSDRELQYLVQQIRTYKEPSFLPERKHSDGASH